MKAKRPESKFEYELCPAGTHLATIFKIINIGTIKEEWEGNEKDSHKIRIYWELPNEPKSYEIEKDGKKEMVNSVFSISQEYTLSFGDRAKLLPIVVGMLGQPFKNEDEAWGYDVEDLLGRSCLLSISHKTSKDGSRQFAVVNSTAPLMKGQEKPQPVNEQSIIDVEKAKEEEIDALYETLRDKIKSSKEWNARIEKGEFLRPEDIPF